MAYTATLVKTTVYGDNRVQHYKVTADAATQAIATGLNVIESVHISPGSLSTAGVKAYANSNASGVEAFGTVGLSGFVSGDVFYMTVFGH